MDHLRMKTILTFCFIFCRNLDLNFCAIFTIIDFRAVINTVRQIGYHKGEMKVLLGLQILQGSS